MESGAKNTIRCYGDGGNVARAKAAEAMEVRVVAAKVDGGE